VLRNHFSQYIFHNIRVHSIVKNDYVVGIFDIADNGRFCKCHFNAILQNTLCPHIYSIFNIAPKTIGTQMSACKQASAAGLHALAGQRCLMLDAMKRDAA
jgi:hypothetical protein